LLALAGRDGTLHLWDFTTGKVQATRQEGVLGFQVVAFSPEGKTLATGGIDRSVTLWDVGGILEEHKGRCTRQSAKKSFQQHNCSWHSDVLCGICRLRDHAAATLLFS
jgi:WD40 repeat protein